MSQQQRIPFLVALLLLGLGYLYAYVPARYVADEPALYADIEYLSEEDALAEEMGFLEIDENSDAYTASALDALLNEETILYEQ